MCIHYIVVAYGNTRLNEGKHETEGEHMKQDKPLRILERSKKAPVVCVYFNTLEPVCPFVLQIQEGYKRNHFSMVWDAMDAAAPSDRLLPATLVALVEVG